ncbi:MAG TPA: hypothetical protein VMZ69_01540 [Saprospiraceae bacterium]|nr:hypothetical protein [Saprospiraceae bacterium]
MKVIFFFFLLLGCNLFISCNDNDDPVAYEYHAHVMQPSSADKHLGDILFIDVEFESHSGEKVEHINIKIHNKANTVVVYDKPDDPHVSQGSDYEFQDQFVLSTANGITVGDWVLEATVWGIDEGQEQVVETVEFHVNP